MLNGLFRTIPPDILAGLFLKIQALHFIKSIYRYKLFIHHNMLWCWFCQTNKPWTQDVPNTIFLTTTCCGFRGKNSVFGTHIPRKLPEQPNWACLDNLDHPKRFLIGYQGDSGILNTAHASAAYKNNTAHCLQCGRCNLRYAFSFWQIALQWAPGIQKPIFARDSHSLEWPWRFAAACDHWLYQSKPDKTT